MHDIPEVAANPDGRPDSEPERESAPANPAADAAGISRSS
jgi:hypothetical protein